MDSVKKLMTGSELAEQIISKNRAVDQYANAMQHALVDIGFWKCCLNCNHWGNNDPDRDQKMGGADPMCHKYGMIPPPQVITYSCVEQWMPIVPF